MKSATLPSFWEVYALLPEPAKQAARKAFSLWRASPFHPSLHFKRIGRLWSVRVGDHYRALGTDVEGGVCWLWIGTHAEYDKLVG